MGSEEDVDIYDEGHSAMPADDERDEAVGDRTSNEGVFVLTNFENLEDDEVGVVEVDAWAPSRINSLFNDIADDSKKTVGSSLDLPVVLITHENIPVVAIKRLKEKCRLHFIEKGDSQEAVLQKACGVNAIFICGYTFKLDREMLDFIGKNLSVVGIMGSGYNHIDVRELTRRKIKISTCRAILVDTVAELAIGLALAVAHRFKEGYLCCSKGKWVTGESDWILGKQLSGSVCGIIGFGLLGSAIAKRLVNFKVKQIFYAGHGERRAAKESTTEFVDLEVLLSQSDFVFIACPLTDETKNMFTYETFRKMRPTCVLINVGKGAVIKTDDLVKALRERLIWGAGLDITDPEPLPTNHPLLHLSNCFVTPHIGSATVTTREAMALLTAENIIAGLEGTTMPTEVCFKPDPKGTSVAYANREPIRTPAKHILNISSSFKSKISKV